MQAIYRTDWQDADELRKFDTKLGQRLNDLRVELRDDRRHETSLIRREMATHMQVLASRIEVLEIEIRATGDRVEATSRFHEELMFTLWCMTMITVSIMLIAVVVAI